MDDRGGRRGFLKSLAAAPLALAPPVPPVASPSPAVSPSPNAAPLDRVSAALVDVVRQRYGSQLGAPDLEEVRKGIESALQSAARLGAVKLGNADEPVTTFRATPRRLAP